MYKIIVFLLSLICLFGIIYMNRLKKNYENSSSREDIIKYFKDKNAISVETGIKTKDLPKEIAKNPDLLMMVKDGTLKYEKFKYFLNQDK